MVTKTANRPASSFAGTLAEAKSIIDSQAEQLTALEFRISPMEQVIAARDQEIKDLKVTIINSTALKTSLERERLINADLRTKVDKLTRELQVIGAIVKSWIVSAKTIKAIVKDHG